MLTGALLTVPAAPAAHAECRVADLQFNPADDLQIVVWIEDAAGNFVDTIYMTRMTATLGLGNRPGRYDFNSEFLWPYGRRENVFPIWAHRHGVVYPRIVFQDNDENDLSHAISHSSLDPYYCRPLRTGEPSWVNTIDSGSCATTSFTDKGTISPTLTSLYPPRNDLTVRQNGDTDDMMTYGGLNALDAISRATPPGGQKVSVLWALPPDLLAGEYVAWIEVSRESDFNASYNPSLYPAPVGIPWSEYGHPYRGQPSVAWRLPFTVSPQRSVFATSQYTGYGDPTGLDGLLNPPDATITTVAGTYSVPAAAGGNPPARTVDNLGAARLLLEAAPEGNYQFRIEVRPEDDAEAPAAPPGLAVGAISADAAHVRFVAPGDDGHVGRAAAYEIRFGLGEPPAEADFQHGTLVADGVRPQAAGTTQVIALEDLLPETAYWVGVRAKDDCLNASAVVFTSFQTPAATGLEVDACFVATAAWGSLMEGHVTSLRQFRDRVLRSTALGEIAVVAYYTFGPALAEVIRPSDTLRALTRDGLSPLVDFARTLVE